MKRKMEQCPELIRYRCCLLEIFTEDSALICAFGHIITLSNIKIILSLLNMRIQAMVF